MNQGAAKNRNSLKLAKKKYGLIAHVQTIGKEKKVNCSQSPK